MNCRRGRPQCVVLWIVGGGPSVQVLLHFCHLTPHQGDSWSCSVHCRSYTHCKTRTALYCDIRRLIMHWILNIIHTLNWTGVFIWTALQGFLRHKIEKGLRAVKSFPQVLQIPKNKLWGWWQWRYWCWWWWCHHPHNHHHLLHPHHPGCLEKMWMVWITPF